MASTPRAVGGFSELPPPIAQVLRQVGRRHRVLNVARGLAVTLAVFLAAMLVAMAVDRFVVIFNDVYRLALTGSAYLLTLLVGLALVVRPVLRRQRPAGLAWSVDRASPEHQERWTTVVELAHSQDPPAVRGSAGMIDRVMREAAAAAPRVNPGSVIGASRARRSWLVALLLAGAMLIVRAAWTEGFDALARRFLLPNLDLARVSLTQVKSITGDATVPTGASLRIEAETIGRPAETVTLILDDPGPDGRPITTRVAMQTDLQRPDRFVHVLRALTHSRRYRIRANDGQTVTHEINVVPRPEITDITLDVTPPRYSGLEPESYSVLPKRLGVLRGTKLKLAVETNKPVEACELLGAGNQPVAMAASGEGNMRFFATLQPRRSYANLRVRLRDEHQFTNRNSPGCRIVVRHDEAPTITIVKPGRRVVLKPQDVLPIHFAAEDDLAVAAVDLLVTPEGQKTTTIAVTLSQDGARNLDGAARLALAKVELGGATRIDYQLRVTDSLPSYPHKGPQRGLSATHTILLDSGAEPFQIQELTSVRTRFHGGMGEMIKQLTEADKHAKAITAVLAKKQPWTKKQTESANKAIEHLDAAQQLADGIVEAGRRTDYTRTADVVREVAFQNIAPAEQHVVQAQNVVDTDEQRAEQIKQAEYQIGRALERLGVMVGQFTQMTAYEDASTRMSEAAARQEALADMVRELAEQEGQRAGKDGGQDRKADGKLDPETAKKLAEIRASQEKLVAQAAEILASNPNMVGPVLEAELAIGKTLNEMVRELGAEQKRLLDDLGKERAILTAGQSLGQLAAAQKKLSAQMSKYDTRGAKAGILSDKQRFDAKVAEQAAAGLEQRKLDVAAPAQQKLLAWSQLAVGEAKKRLAETQAGKVDDPKAPTKAAGDATALAKQARALAEAHKKHGNQVVETVKQARQAAKKAKDGLGAKLAAAVGDWKKQQKTLSEESGKLLGQAAAQPETKDLAGKLDPRAVQTAADAKLAKSDIAGAAAQQDRAAERMDMLAAVFRTVAEAAAANAGKALGQQLPALAKLTERQRGLQSAVTEARKKHDADVAKDKAAADKALAAGLAQLAKEQQQLQADVDKAVAPLSGSIEPVAEAAKKHDTGAEMKSIGEALAKGDDKAAGAGAKAAAEKLAQLSAALKQLASLKPAQLAAKTAGGQLADGMDKAAVRQKALGDAARAAKKASDAALAAVTPDVPAARMKQLGDAGTKLQQQTGAVAASATKLLAAEPAKPAGRAIASAAKAKESLAGGKTKESAAAHAKTAEHLGALAKRLDALAAEKTELVKRMSGQAVKKAASVEAIEKNLKAGEQIVVAQQTLITDAQKALTAHATGLDALLAGMRQDLLGTQKKLADRADKLAEQAAVGRGAATTGKASAKAHPAAPKAARLAHEIAQAIESGKIEPAAQAGEQVVTILGELANEMFEPIPPSPDNWDEYGQQLLVRTAVGQEAEALALRQKDVLAQLEALGKGEPHVATMVRQRALRDRTVEIGDAVELLKWQVEPLDAKAQATAAALHKALSADVPAQQESARGLLKDKQLAKAAPPMTKAAQGLGSASKLLDKLSAQLAAASKGHPASPEDRARMAEEALEAMQEQFDAMQAMNTDQFRPDTSAQATLQAAAAQTQLAADQIAKTAQNFLREAIELGRADMPLTDDTQLSLGMGGGSARIPMMLPDTELLNLDLLGISRVQWATLPSQLRDEVIQAAEKLPPNEYRDLIKRYFRQISQRAATSRSAR